MKLRPVKNPVCYPGMRTLFRLIVLVSALMLHRSLFAAEVQLGDPPPAPTPEQVARLRRHGPIVLGPGVSYSVNIASREDVRNFFNTVYAASQGFSIGWTGDLSSCAPGTTDPTFRGLVALRINYFRAMAGIPAGIMLDDTYGAYDQEAALMMSAANNLNHFPPPGWPCYTGNGSHAASNSNLALGNAGPDATTAYIDDFGGNNSEVGHRRWILYPQTQTMGTGDVDRSGPGEPRANATWVFDGNYGGPRPVTRDNFVSWPPPGYVPYQVVFPRWSLSYPNANFNIATVTMSTNGVNIPVTLETVLTGYGENTLVWYPTGLNTTSHYDWPRPSADTVYTVHVQNVSGSSVPASFNYAVTVFDPQVTGPDSVVPIISGPDQPSVGFSNTYTFNAVTNATGYQGRQAQRAAFTAVEGAENGLTSFTANTASDYSVIVTSPVATGTHAFHLAHTQPDSQILTCTRVLLTGTNSQMQFRSRLGYASTVEFAKVQISLDQGISWQDVYTQTGNGVPGETSYNTQTISLSGFTNQQMIVRFNYDLGFGSYYNAADTGYGWYIDDISFSNTEELTNPVITDIAAGTSFSFVPAQATNYALNVRAQLYNKFPLEWGPVKRVAASASLPMSLQFSTSPSVSGNQVQIDFDVANYRTGTMFQLLKASDPAAAWNPDGAASFQTVTPNTKFRATTTTGGASQAFYQLKAN